MPSTRTTAESVAIVRDLLNETSAARSSVLDLMDRYGELGTITDKEQLSTARAEVVNKIVAGEAVVERLTTDLTSEIGALRRRASDLPLTDGLASNAACVAAGLLMYEGMSRAALGEEIVVGFSDEDMLVCVDLTTAERAGIIAARWNPEAGYRFTAFSGRPSDLDMLIGFAVDI